MGAQLLVWAHHPEVWLSAVLVLGSLCTSLTAARLAHHRRQSMLVWGVLGLVPVLGQLWVAYLAGAPGHDVIYRLDRIEDFLIRGIPPERLQALLKTSHLAEAADALPPTAPLATSKLLAAGEAPAQGAVPPRATT